MIHWAADAGFGKYIPLVFIKNYSPQVLKANMKIVGATEHALVLYRDRLPKFNNDGQMIFNWMQWTRDGKEIPKIHPTQKPIELYSWVLRRCAKEDDKILDTHAGSASSLIACHRAGYEAWGFEINEEYFRMAKARLDREKAQVSMYELI